RQNSRTSRCSKSTSIPRKTSCERSGSKGKARSSPSRAPRKSGVRPGTPVPPRSRRCWTNQSEAAAMGKIGLAFIAGVLSTLSPCVLPLLPIILGTAISKHRAGPVALAAGLAISFVTVGLFVAVIGYSIGLDDGVFRAVSAVLIIGIGVVLLVPRFQAQLAFAGAPVSSWIEQQSAGFS